MIRSATLVHAIPSSTAPEVIRQTEAWLVLSKPARWHSVAQEKPGDDAPNVETWLRDRFAWAQTLPEAGLVHRLDFETTGCLLVARSATAQSRLQGALRSEEGAIRKIYLALAAPGLEATGEFRLFFTSRYRRSRKVTVREGGEARHEGRCRWRVLESRRKSDLVEIEITGPGRRHQIRAGLAFLGHPLLGDRLYAGAAWPHGLALHAWRLVIDGETVECPSPEAWRASSSPR